MPLFSDVTCPFCGCLCDDLTVTVEGDQIVQAKRACPIALSNFKKLDTQRPALCRYRNSVCSLDSGYQAAAKLFKQSRAPMIFGMGSTDTDGQRLAIQLADELGALIDTAGAPLTRAATLAMQQAGLSTCSLGEVRQRADLVIFWGADPLQTHPRLLERYAAEPVSEFLPNGRSDRTLISLNSEPTKTESKVDLSLRIVAGQDAELLSALRQLIRKHEVPEEPVAGLPMATVQNLFYTMSKCRYGTIFFGPGFLNNASPALVIEELYQLVSELNAINRFTVRGLSNPGAENVLTWQSGFPLAVNFQQKSPRYQPGEFSASELLEREDVDSCLLIGSQAVENLSPKARESLSKLPIVCIDPPHLHRDWQPTVQFTAAQPGVQSTGTMYRMDDVALPVRQLYESRFPDTRTILEGILARLHHQSD